MNIIYLQDFIYILYIYIIWKEYVIDMCKTYYTTCTIYKIRNKILNFLNNNLILLYFIFLFLSLYLFSIKIYICICMY